MPRSNRTSATAFAVAGTLTAMTAIACAEEAMPPRRARAPVASAMPDVPAPGAGGGVKAVVVKSWGQCESGDLVWDDLNAHWSRYGNTPIRIDYANPELCGASMTYDALVASGAQTVIVSDPDTQSSQFSDQEVQDLTRYVQEGHNLIGTFLLLHWRNIDNRALAPLFGLDPTQGYYVDRSVETDFTIRSRIPLFKGLDGRYASSGYHESQEPQGHHWSPAASGDAKVIGYDRGHRAAILSYCGTTYRALYFTWMPEYLGNAQDEQVLYNAIVSGLRPACDG